MKTLYLDCSNGAAGDMLASALWELTPNNDEVLKEINAAGIPGVKVFALPSVKHGVSGTHFQVTVNGEEEKTENVLVDTNTHSHTHEHTHGHHHNHVHIPSPEHGNSDAHHHSSLQEIIEIINALNVSESVKNDAISVYKLIAEAESQVHGTTVTDIHFHEVGTMDAIADIICVSLLIEKLSPDCIISSSVHTGTGTVKCAHGILPVPAPATAYLLHGIPVYTTEIKGELCTPTGAALLKHFVSSFGPMPVMNIENIGYGMGSKDYETANYLRAMLGQSSTNQTLQYETPKHISQHSSHPVNHSKEQTKMITNRLSRTIGHLESVKRMVEDNRDASDVLIQLSAVQSTITSTARVIIKEHVKHSNHNAAKSNDPDAMNSLYGIIDKFIK